MLNPNGSGDDNFHSFKPTEYQQQTREELSRGTALLTWHEDDNDPFVDYEDDEELETNETVIDNDTD